MPSKKPIMALDVGPSSLQEAPVRRLLKFGVFCWTLRPIFRPQWIDGVHRRSSVHSASVPPTGRLWNYAAPHRLSVSGLTESSPRRSLLVNISKVAEYFRGAEAVPESLIHSTSSGIRFMSFREN